jgi:hypothetical protein
MEGLRLAVSYIEIDIGCDRDVNSAVVIEGWWGDLSSVVV